LRSEWLLPARKEQGTGPVANAGSVNPTGSAQVCEAVGRKLGLRGVRIGVVDGDDTLGRVGKLSVDGQLAHLDTGEPLGAHLDAMRGERLPGAAPIVAVLGDGPVLTGRVADAALTLGPLLHEHG